MQIVRECLVTNYGVTCLQYANYENYLLFYTIMKLIENVCSDVWEKKLEMKNIDIATICE